MLANLYFDEKGLLWLIPIAILVYSFVSFKLTSFHLGKPWQNFNQNNVFLFPFALLIKKSLNDKVDGRVKGFTPVMLLIVFSLIIISLAQPVLPGEKKRITQSQRQIVLVLDNSISMMIKDYVVSDLEVDRMNFSKQIAKRLLTIFKNEKIAIVVYSDKAQTLVPFTKDTDLLQIQVARIDTELTGRSNGMSKGLALAAKLIITAKSYKKFSQSMVVLLSHGTRVIDEENLANTVAFYKDKRIRLETIGIGRLSRYKKKLSTRNELSEVLFDPVNVTLLQSIAAHTKGALHLINKASETKKLVQAMRELAREGETVRTQTVKHSLYRPPLLLALVLLLLWQLFSTMRLNRPRHKSTMSSR